MHEPIKIQEAFISGYRPLKHWISVTLNIKDEDVSKIDKELLEELWKTWDSVAGWFQWFKTEKVKNHRGFLHNIMERHCNINWIELSDELKKVYTRYNITTRKDLTDEQVDFLIESYKL